MIWEFLQSDAGRVVLTIMATLVSATIAITLFILNRKRKRLVYTVLSKTRVLRVGDGVRSRVKVLVDEMPVQDLGLVHVKIRNGGTDPIRASEFVQPVSFRVGSQCRIIDAAVVRKEPPGIDTDLDKADQRVILRPALLNAKEALTIKLLIADFDGRLLVDARIEGTELKESPQGILDASMIAAFLVPCIGSVAWSWLGRSSMSLLDVLTVPLAMMVPFSVTMYIDYRKRSRAAIPDDYV